MLFLPAVAPAVPQVSQQQGLHRAVARSTLMLVGAQLLTTPISIVLNMVLTRRLGAEEFGTLFLAGNLTSLAFLAVDWGQSQSIAGEAARDPACAPRLLGTGLLWKALATIAAAIVLWLLGLALGYGRQVQLALALSSAQCGLATLAANYGAVLRARDQLSRYSLLVVIAGAANFAFTVPVLLLGGQLAGVLLAQGAAAALSLLLFFGASWRAGVRAAAPDRQSAETLLRTGSGFLLLGVVLALQPALDTVLLSKLAPAEVVGWHSAARRFIGFLIFPATTLNFAVYPTLARLARESEESFLALTRAALRAVVIFGVPAGVGCVLYAPLAIRLFSGPAFAPAAQVLQVLALFVFLVYFSIILGAALAALDHQTPWALVQLGCVAISAAFDPLLIPVFQRRMGNGAIGVSVTSAASELLMVAGGIWLAPRGLIDRSVRLACGRCLLAGAAMMGASFAAAGLPWPIDLGLSLAAYLLVLALSGGLEREQVGLVVEAVRRKTARLRDRESA